MFRFDLNTSALAAAMDRLKGELPTASREAVLLTAEESLTRVSQPLYWRNGTGKGKRTASTFRVVLLGTYSSRVTSSSPIAGYLNDGTKAHAIMPSRKKFLRFVQNGAVRFAKRVWHPGTKALNYEAAEQRAGQKDIETFGDAALQRAVARSGLG